MSVETVYTCDRCKKRVNEPRDFYTIGLYWDSYIQHYRFNTTNHVSKMQHWCRDCIELFGLTRSIPQRVAPIQPQPTLEDFIKELINNAIEDKIAEIKGGDNT